MRTRVSHINDHTWGHSAHCSPPCHPASAFEENIVFYGLKQLKRSFFSVIFLHYVLDARKHKMQSKHIPMSAVRFYCQLFLQAMSCAENELRTLSRKFLLSKQHTLGFNCRAQQKQIYKNQEQAFKRFLCDSSPSTYGISIMHSARRQHLSSLLM